MPLFSSPRERRLWMWALAVAATLLLAWALPRMFSPPGPAAAPETPAPPAAVAPSRAAGERAIAEAFRDRRSGVWVEAGGVVERLLADDREGSRHQRFIVRLGSGQTLLVAHNIDLAPRVPLRVGDRVGFRGQYEWNAEGGVIHWTHHDPQGAPGGWLEHEGRIHR